MLPSIEYTVPANAPQVCVCTSDIRLTSGKQSHLVVASWWVSVCGLMYVCVLALLSLWCTCIQKQVKSSTMSMFRSPSICCQYLCEVILIIVWGYKWVWECVSPVECEEPYLWFSAYQDFYFLHIALCAAKTEALQGHRDAQLFIVRFNKTWISAACACRHHSHFFAKMGLANFSQSALGQRQGAVSLNFY